MNIGVQEKDKYHILMYIYMESRRIVLMNLFAGQKWRSSFPCGSAGKESACNAGDLGLIPGLGRFPGEGNGCPLQYSGLENSMDCTVHGVEKSRTQLSDFHLNDSLELIIHLNDFT